MTRAGIGVSWWGLADTLAHRLKLPRWLRRPICDLYDVSLGLPMCDLIEMDYHGKAPWWLRHRWRDPGA